MKARDIYKLVERIEETNIISVKWVYILKFDDDGIFVDKKSKIIAKKYSQVQGVDFKETYVTIILLQLKDFRVDQ